MPNLTDYTITPVASTLIEVPRFRVEGKLVTDDGSVVADFTGPNALTFPDCTTQLNFDQAMVLISDFGTRLLNIIAGLE